MRSSGLTLIELAIEGAVISLVVISVFGVFSHAMVGRQTVAAEKDFRHTLREMNDEVVARIRRAKSIDALTAQAIYLTDSDGIRYAYQATNDPANPDLNMRMLRWNITANTRKFIEGADNFSSKDFFGVCSSVPGTPNFPGMSGPLKSLLSSLYNSPPSCPANPPDANFGSGVSNTLAPGCYGKLNVSNGAVLTLSPGDYTFKKDITVDGGSAVVMNVGACACNGDGTAPCSNVRWYAYGKINVQGGSGVNVTVTLDKKGKIKNMAAAPSCYLYILDYDREIKIGGGSILSAQIYAPSLRKFEVKGGSQVPGQASVPGAVVKVTKNSTLGSGNGNGIGACANCSTGCLNGVCTADPCYTVSDQFVIIDMILSKNGQTLHSQTMVRRRKDQ